MTFETQSAQVETRLGRVNEAERLYTTLMKAVESRPGHEAAQVFAIELRDWTCRQSNLVPSQREELREFTLAMSLFGDRLEEDATLRARAEQPWWRRIFK